MIWNRIPKATHVGINNLSLGVYDAIAHFNYGMKTTIRNLKSRDKFEFPRSSLKSCYFFLGFPRIPTLLKFNSAACDICTVVLSDNKYNGRLNRSIISDRAFSTLTGRGYRILSG